MATRKPLSHDDYTVGWICALPVEAAAGKAMLDDEHQPLRQEKHDHNKYTLGRVGCHNVVVTCLPAGVPGTNAAAIVATQMLRTFTQIRFCLMVGIGGGVPSHEHDIRLGDVAVGLSVVQYDFGKTVQGGKFHHTGPSNRPPNFLLAVVSELRAKHMLEGTDLSGHLSRAFKKYTKMAATFTFPGQEHDFLYESDFDHPEGLADCSQCDKQRLVSRSTRPVQEPIIHYGPIASGNQVMRHGATREKLRKQEGVVCFEMEAAGLVDVFPCLVVRGICDYSDSHKNKKWQPYAAVTAACFAKEFLSEIEAVHVQEVRTAADTTETFHAISRTQSQNTSFQTSSPVSLAESRQMHTGANQLDDSSNSVLAGFSRLDNQQISNHAHGMAGDISHLKPGIDLELSDESTLKSDLISVLAIQAFQDALGQFKACLSDTQLSAFRSVTFRSVRSTLMRLQRVQAERFGAMNFARLRKFLESIRLIEKEMQFAQKAEFLSYVLGTMVAALQDTADILDPCDTLVKVYETIGASITFGHLDSAYTLNAPQKHLVLARVAADVLRLNMLILQVLGIPKPFLGAAFKSTWNALLPQRESIFQNLEGMKELVEKRAAASAFVEHEQNRGPSLTVSDRDTVRLREQWSELQQWLAGVNTLQIHQDICRVRQGTADSGAWLLKQPKYVAWKSDDVPRWPILWLNGILGAGKTILVSKIIDDCRTNSNVVTAFFYCHHDEPQRRSFMSILRTLIAQLLTVRHILLPWCYEQYSGSNQLYLMDGKMCEHMLTALLLSHDRTVVLLDGLDECEAIDRKQLLDFFTRAVSICESHDPGKLRVMFASRDEPGIRRALHGSVEITITPANNEGDMKRFIKVWCQKICDKFEDLEAAEVSYIEESTLSRADGMFLFANLVMTNLEAQVSLQALQEQIHPENFPSELDAAYERILRRVSKDSDREKVSLAKKVLGWMMCAKRPLKWHEIQGALSTDTTSRTVDFAQRRSHVHIREICGSLISELSGDRLELVHVSAKNYLKKSSFVTALFAECTLASLCLNYLSFDCFEKQLPEALVQDFMLRGSFALQDYATSHWSDHAATVIRAGLSDLRCEGSASEDFCSAVIDFVEHYHLGAHESTESAEIPSDCLKFQELSCFVEVCHLYRHIQRQKAKGRQGFDEITPPPLDQTIARNRSCLEQSAKSTTLDPATQKELEQCYGRQWYKCTKAACYYFHEGFQDEKSREYHAVRHDHPFRCQHEECESGYKFGFTSLKQLEKHVSLYHPESVKIKATFARLSKARERVSNSPMRHSSIAKEPGRFSCHICSKTYTRQEKLNNHLRTHYVGQSLSHCSVDGCGKSFARDDERKRHEKEVHSGEKKFLCAGNTKYGKPGSNSFGCGRGFTRLAGLESHWRSRVGKDCLKPLLDEEEFERQLADQVAKRKAEGFELPLPRALYDKYPELRKSATLQDPSLLEPAPKRRQPFKPSAATTALSSEAGTQPSSDSSGANDSEIPKNIDI
ncbi:hypothetical protein Z517_03326 [Fonsecaea pedrosoi CBS 271.37]|uniref:C2H2-type domain-containing protein n=1 Tax=Fonsecaea pedrosoi CBS 271.37 TaxID=1442368 RepID=A0A0D2GZQ0_9EURO|nr:uncharacterized protein Z517_03326 [Fonsecaea pedrosoi CBS 271.37]KIW84080.1 hypothetical protein Z517_03326 [Fonsecaea pedrosoi CBS 271.37]